MHVNHDPRRHRVVAASAAPLGQRESPPLRRRPVTDADSGFPASGLPAVSFGRSSEEDTPVYWQTVQAMLSARWRPDRKCPTPCRTYIADMLLISPGRMAETPITLSGAALAADGVGATCVLSGSGFHEVRQGGTILAAPATRHVNGQESVPGCGGACSRVGTDRAVVCVSRSYCCLPVWRARSTAVRERRAV